MRGRSVGDFKGRSLIFCHGNGETAVSEKDLFAELAQAGVSVICPDYRGYGQSAGDLAEVRHCDFQIAMGKRHLFFLGGAGQTVRKLL